MEDTHLKNNKFYICAHCGNIVELIQDGGVPMFCCGQAMDELIPGSVDHPMVDVHWIEWVQLVTDKGSYRKQLNPGQAPHVSFLLQEEKPLEVYAYCNLHGLWKKDLN